MTKSGKKWNVDLLKMTCRKFVVSGKLQGIPYVHTVVVIRKRRDKWIQYTSPFFSIDSFKKTYAGYVMPIENVEDWKVPDKMVFPPPFESKSLVDPRSRG
ncbi:hypothetical protein IFM89_012569 [Coptis chinensis]|uniref:Uncharacterized protein n=1 Tax=Coptis chinensis TaxID=261450 RepID=A0A835H4N8_9MAGN|nr:hypothetical protein IFM89_012569 [Coptis chinensis]